MPYRRKYNSTYKKIGQGYKPYAPSRIPRRPKTANVGEVARIAGYAAKGVRYLSGIINSEKKMYTNTYNTAAIQLTGHVIPITPIPQGDALNERVGNSILVKNLHIRGNISMNASASTTQFRMCIIQDLEHNGTDPTGAQVLEYDNTAYAPISPILHTSHGRFKILWDHQVMLHDSKPIVTFKKYFKLGNIHVKYTGSSAVNREKNNLFIIAWSDQSTDHAGLALVWRVQYHDN